MKKTFIALCLVGFTIPAAAQIYLDKNFNTGTLSQGGVFITACVTPRNPGFITDSFNTGGNLSFYASVSKGDSVCGGSHRTEINTSKITFAPAEWMYWETYQPAYQPNDVVPFSSGQIHGAVNVPFSLWFINGNCQAVIQSSVTNNSVLSVNRIFSLGPISKGVWHKWLIHFKRSAGMDGFFELWEDGAWKFRYNGPTSDVIAGAGEVDWYAKWGIYKWNILSSIYDTTVSVTDNIKLGGATCVYEDFFPLGPLPPGPDPDPAQLYPINWFPILN